ncbi:MAG TPA: sigma-70 family RNA polymerase sigma factor [Pyrinomonadaceae bacterium]|nr:sigma-70 family RNA polymerase sigma factor [Pyrinomonadaceae bacterium]
MRSPERETWLVLRAQAGDREAFDELLRGVQAQLFRYLLRLAGERELAEDVLQEVFIRVYRKLVWLHDPALFRPWAYRIATREAFKALRRERRWTEQVRDEELLASLPAREEDEGADADLIARLPRLVARVSPASRAVLLLHYLDELTLEEVSDVLELSTGTVKSRLAYGLATLRRLLGRDDETTTTRKGKRDGREEDRRDVEQAD